MQSPWVWSEDQLAGLLLAGVAVLCLWLAWRLVRRQRSAARIAGAVGLGLVGLLAALAWLFLLTFTPRLF